MTARREMCSGDLRPRCRPRSRSGHQCRVAVEVPAGGLDGVLGSAGRARPPLARFRVPGQPRRRGPQQSRSGRPARLARSPDPGAPGSGGRWERVAGRARLGAPRRRCRPSPTIRCRTVSGAPSAARTTRSCRTARSLACTSGHFGPSTVGGHRRSPVDDRGGEVNDRAGRGGAQKQRAVTHTDLVQVGSKCHATFNGRSSSRPAVPNAAVVVKTSITLEPLEIPAGTPVISALRTG